MCMKEENKSVNSKEQCSVTSVPNVLNGLESKGGIDVYKRVKVFLTCYVHLSGQV